MVTPEKMTKQNDIAYTDNSPTVQMIFHAMVTYGLPANTISRHDAGVKLKQRFRRSPTINPTLDQSLVFVGESCPSHYFDRL